MDIEDKLDKISWLEKGERIVDICCNVRLAHNNVCTIHANNERIKESAKSGTKVCLCSKTTKVLMEWTITKTMHVCVLHF